MKTVKFDAKFEEKSSRLELLVRWVWMIPYMFVAMVIGILFMFVWGFQFLHVLFTGKKHKQLFTWTKQVLIYEFNFAAYFYILTDERSPIIPEDK